MEFVDLGNLEKSERINLLLPGWKRGERVAFFSPHDDDAILGAGYLILASVRFGGIPKVCVFCRGDAGYSTPAEKTGVVEKRKREARSAYGLLGVKKQDIRFFGILDFSLMTHIDRRPPRGQGLFDKIISMLRRESITRVFFSSGHFEHWDHTAVFYAGVYTCAQAQDPILADLGRPHRIKTHLSYSVWSDFEPAPDRQRTRADLGILVNDEDEKRVIEAISQFSTQARIIKDLVVRRKERKKSGRYLELYKSYRLRPSIDYAPYFDLLKKIKRRGLCTPSG